MSATCPEQRGFSLVSAIFLLVVLAALAAALVKVSGMQHMASASDAQGARAYQAARAGAEWGLYTILDPDGSVQGVSATPPSCWSGSSTVTPAGNLSGFAVAVTCTATSTTELTRTIAVYTIVSTATLGTAGQPGFISRQVQVSVSRCKDPSNAPTFAC